MERKCNKCGYEWDCKSKMKFYITCPQCLAKVKIAEVKKE